MPLDLGDHPARLAPASGLIAEIGMEPPIAARMGFLCARAKAFSCCKT
jgi:hypothetical protein